MKSDISTIRKIFKEEIYQSPIALLGEISKIKDKKLQLGLIVDLFVRKDQYEIENFDFGLLTEGHEMEQGLEAHEYYIDKLNDSPVLTFSELIFKTQKVEENQDLINWIKSISEQEVKEVVEYCIEEEVYELITFIKSLR